MQIIIIIICICNPVFQISSILLLSLLAVKQKHIQAIAISSESPLRYLILASMQKLRLTNATTDSFCPDRPTSATLHRLTRRKQTELPQGLYGDDIRCRIQYGFCSTGSDPELYFWRCHYSHSTYFSNTCIKNIVIRETGGVMAIFISAIDTGLISIETYNLT